MDKEGYRLRLFVIGTALLAVYFFVFGESGLLERMKLERERAGLQRGISELRSKNADLAGTLQSYRRGSVAREDYLRAGYVSPGERVVFLKKGPHDTGKSVAPPAEDRAEQLPDIYHLRILWGVLSAMVILFYMARTRRHVEIET